MSLFKNIENEIKFYIDTKDNVWGVDNPPPINLPAADWRNYKTTFKPQSFQGKDLEICSQSGGCLNDIATTLNWKLETGQLSAAFVNFSKNNGYLDVTNRYNFSWRFTAILDGTSINGNTMQNGWKCVQKYGLIPDSMLPWTDEMAAQYPDEASMDEAYYNPSVITQAMLDMGKQFNAFVAIEWGWIGDGTTSIPLPTLSLGTQTSCLAIATPIPTPVSLWNAPQVPFTPNTTIQHCTSLDFVDVTGVAYPSWITDQYIPQVKQLESNYPIFVAIAHVINMLA